MDVAVFTPLIGIVIFCCKALLGMEKLEATLGVVALVGEVKLEASLSVGVLLPAVTLEASLGVVLLGMMTLEASLGVVALVGEVKLEASLGVVLLGVLLTAVTLEASLGVVALVSVVKLEASLGMVILVVSLGMASLGLLKLDPSLGEGRLEASSLGVVALVVSLGAVKLEASFCVDIVKASSLVTLCATLTALPSEVTGAWQGWSSESILTGFLPSKFLLTSYWNCFFSSLGSFSICLSISITNLLPTSCEDFPSGNKKTRFKQNF